ncbi:MAG: DUF4440 domain-containing protein [Bacteroidia bacterium]
MNQENKDLSVIDKAEIDEIVRQFFDLFTNTGGKTPNLWNIKKIFLEDGLIINNTPEKPAIYNLESFIKPREEILTNGTLTNFEEWETDSKTEIYGNIAQRMCRYQKAGELHGEPFTGKGTKLMQFLKVGGQWRLSSVIWSDGNE